MIRVAIVLAFALLSLPAQAQPAGAQAEVLFREGRELMTAGKYAEACAAFEQSQKLEPAITTLLNLAGCREKAGQLATAWGLFLDAERQTRAASDNATKKLNDVAKSRAQKIEPRVSKLTINVPQRNQVDGLEILRDKERVEAVMWNRALPIDGGTYTISAHSPGVSTWSTQITVGAEGDTKSVDIPDMRTLPRQPAQPTSPATPADQTVSSKEQDEPEEEPVQPAARSKVLPISVAVGAVALLGGAVTFHLWGNATYDDAKAEMIDQARRDSLYDSANQKRYIATGLAAAGVAAAGVSVWLFMRSGGDERHTHVAFERHVVVSPTGIALRGTF
jgi:serine/threonine-protein kinase